jgi:hypothetical protein
VGYSATNATLSGLVSGALFNSSPGALADYNFDTAPGCTARAQTAVRLIDGMAAVVPGGDPSKQLE